MQTAKKFNLMSLFFKIDLSIYGLEFLFEFLQKHPPLTQILF